jgi:hypothetical protein
MKTSYQENLESRKKIELELGELRQERNRISRRQDELYHRLTDLERDGRAMLTELTAGTGVIRKVVYDAKNA